MKKSVLFCLGLVAVLAATSAFAGALNRPAAVGTRDVGLGTDPCGLYIPHNSAGRTQTQDNDWHLETGLELMMPRFTYEDVWGHKQTSKNVAHALPLVSASKRVSDKLVLSLDINTPFGLGASFEKNRQAWGQDTSTLVSLTDITVSAAYQLTDKLSVSAGPVIGFGQLKWVAPFDINRHPLPIETDSHANGFGLGWTAALFYEVNEHLALAVNYTSELQTDLNGDTDISVGLVSLNENRFDSSFTFPDKLDVALAIKANPKLLFTLDWNRADYSSAQKQVVIDFRHLPMKKPLLLDWGVVQSAHAGVSYQLNDAWTLRGGVGWMSCGINNIDSLTLDVPGYDVAAGVSWRHKNFELNASYTFAWGETSVPKRFAPFLEEKYGAKISTFGLSGSFAF